MLHRQKVTERFVTLCGKTRFYYRKAKVKVEEFEALRLMQRAPDLYQISCYVCFVLEIHCIFCQKWYVVFYHLRPWDWHLSPLANVVSFSYWKNSNILKKLTMQATLAASDVNWTHRLFTFHNLGKPKKKKTRRIKVSENTSQQRIVVKIIQIF